PSTGKRGNEMTEEGPELQALTHRLAECPGDFLAEPLIGRAGTIHTAAVVADLLQDLGGAFRKEEDLSPFRSDSAERDRNRLQAVLIAAWLLHDPWFRGKGRYADKAYNFITEVLPAVAGLVKAPALVSDPERREELARLALKGLGLRPAGESDTESQDRLAAVSSVERRRVILESRSAQKRAAEIREAMRKKAAEEAAAKAARE
ncbi:MAG TPA: hypothetical protein VLS90_14375, partial [Thermodesulfobacteriota bacterium]|nr:hypothetical protein [Thermodesulfobacteriota bacterium]